MGLDDTNPETNGSTTFDITPGDGTPTPPTPSQEDEKGLGPEGLGKTGTPVGDGPNPAAHIAAGFTNEIQALKTKIFELERRAKVDPAGQGSDPSPLHPAGPGPAASCSQLMADIEQYKRMEECLYRHRKEWEDKVGPGYWHMLPEPRGYLRSGQPGPWNHTWLMDKTNKYSRVVVNGFTTGLSSPSAGAHI